MPELGYLAEIHLGTNKLHAHPIGRPSAAGRPPQTRADDCSGRCGHPEHAAEWALERQPFQTVSKPNRGRFAACSSVRLARRSCPPT